MTVIGALSSFRELGEMSPHKRASNDRPIAGEMPTCRSLTAKAKTLLPASMFVDSENSERADVRNATKRNDWGCLNGWSDC